MAKTKAASRDSRQGDRRKSKKRSKDLLNSTGGLSSNPHASTSSSSAAAATTDEKVPTVPELITAATALLHQQSSPKEALALTTKALQLSPTSLPALELFAETHIELGDEETARQAFNQAASLDPDGKHEDEGGSGPEKFLWLAQLAESPEESVGHYDRAVDVLRRWKQERDSGKRRAELVERRLEEKMVSALCAMAEIYMDDLCMEPDAESRCEKYMAEALLVVPESPEALQTLASVRISQIRVEEAVGYLNRSFEVWKEKDLNSPDIPSYATRIALSKLLIETEQHETAVEVLERLQEEDDQLPDLWYLGGWALFLLGEKAEDEPAKMELWSDARDWLRNCEMLYKILEWEDEGIKDHASELLKQVDAVVPEGMEAEEEGDGEEGEEWESASEDEVMKDS